MGADETHEITRLLLAWGQGDEAAYEELAWRVYDELHRIARGQMRGERAEHLLNASALVSELFLKLAACQQVDWENRQHFFNFAAMLMRQVLVNYAKAHKSIKRGEGAQAVTLEETLLRAERREMSLDDLLALDQALERLEEEDGRCARVVELRFFGGFSTEEIAEALSVADRTVKRDWRFARL